MQTCVFWFRLAIVLLVLAPTAARAQPQSSQSQSGRQTPAGGIPTAATDPRELANQINNPAAPVTLVQFRNILLPDVAGASGATNTFEIQPVLPIGPFASFKHVQLMKITLPFNSLPQPVGVSGLGDLQVFDLVSIKESWGRWGFGPALVFPTARAVSRSTWPSGVDEIENGLACHHRPRLRNRQMKNWPARASRPPMSRPVTYTEVTFSDSGTTAATRSLCRALRISGVTTRPCSRDTITRPQSPHQYAVVSALARNVLPS